MKIFIFSKKRLVSCCLFIFIIFVLFIIYLILHSPKTFAIELSYNSIVSDEFKNKINNLTQGEEKIAYLTFDDGPNISVTPKILDILKSENIKATFFVIGKNVDEHPEIVKRAYDEGHYIFHLLSSRPMGGRENIFINNYTIIDNKLRGL